MQLSRFFHSTTSLFISMSSTTTSSNLPMAAAATTAVTSLDLSGKKGEFQRSTAKWRHWIRATSDADGMYLCASFFHFLNHSNIV
jgi:hypothetical protein